MTTTSHPWAGFARSTGTRPYRQTRRAESAAATRQRIIDAARDQLVTGEPFTIAAVARRAGVSRVTVYTLFGDRDQLREAVFDDLADTGGLTDLPSVFTAADPVEGIERLIAIFCGFYATHRTVLRRLNALAALSARAEEREPDRNRRRRHILTVLLTRLSERPAYTGLDIEATAGQLQALTSFELYDQLASNTEDTPPAQVIRRLARALLAPESAL